MRTDLLVVGAGPAGVSAALWARSLDLEVALIESGPAPGGQLHHIHFPPRNFAGSVAGDGAAIAARLGDQLAAAGVHPQCDTVAVGIEGGPEQPVIVTSAGARLPAGAALVATGVRKRRLGVPGERELEGRGVTTSATRDRARLVGRRVAVVGGGDAAYENALLLARAGSEVLLVVRDHPLARMEFRRAVEAEPVITVLQPATVVAVLGGHVVRGVRLQRGETTEERAVDAVVVKVGVVPNTEWCAGVLTLDPEGYVVVDATLRASRPRVWAAGDVARPPRPGLSAAIGQGAVAVAAIRAELRGD
jgi:thioredoxin reductase (NADPH)